MLDVISPKCRLITKVYREGNGLYLTAEAGLLRLLPEKEGIVRVSFTDKENFTEGQGRHIKDLSDLQMRERMPAVLKGCGTTKRQRMRFACIRKRSV